MLNKWVRSGLGDTTHIVNIGREIDIPIHPPVGAPAVFYDNIFGGHLGNNSVAVQIVLAAWVTTRGLGSAPAGV